MNDRIGTANHFIGSPPHSRGSGNPPKFMVSSRPTPRRWLYSFGPTYTMKPPSQRPPAGTVGPLRNPIAVWSGVDGLIFGSVGLGSEVVKISKPSVRAITAAVYQLLPSAIQSPGLASVSICVPFLVAPRNVLRQP